MTGSRPALAHGIPFGATLAAALSAVAGALLLLVVLAGPASAHASLVATTPSDGSTVPAVDEVTLEFNEAVSAPPGGLRVFDDTGERVDDGQPRNVSTAVVAVDVAAGLTDGGYIVTWRVVSADGHPIRGAFLFSVGTEGAVDDALIARLFAGDGGALVGPLAALTRAAGYAGTLVAAGALAYILAVAGDDRERRRGRTWARRGAITGLVAALLSVPLQAMVVTGFGPVEALAPDVLATIVVSSVGQAAVVRLLALAAVLGVLVRWRGRGQPDRVTAALAAVAVLSFALDGHTRTVEPLWLMWLADLVHLAAAAAWLGGLVVLTAALRERRLDDEPVAAAGLVARYSRLATAAVVAVTLAGSAMTWASVRAPRAFTSTAYGWTLVAKLVIAAVIIAIGVFNHRRLVPAVARAARPVPAGGADDVDTAAAPVDTAVDGSARTGWRYLQRTTRFEAGLMAAVLVVTGFLVNLRPAAEAAGITGIFETTQSVTAGVSLNLVVDPNRAGENQIHLYLLDETGRPSDDVEQVTLGLRLPDREIGPIVREPFVAGPGHWQLNGSELSIPGEWVIDVTVGIDRFTEETVSVPVVVNPA